MIPSESVRAMWKAFSSAQPEPPCEGVACSAWHFCDNRVDADELAELVRAGTKRATAGSLWAYEAVDEPLPQAGDLRVITDWDGQAACVIRTLSVDIVPFDEVSHEFAAMEGEGEGDGSLEHWRRGHLAFFTRGLAELGRRPTPVMPVVCECFEVVHTSASPRG